MAPRTPPGDRPRWVGTPAEEAAMTEGIARLVELHGPPTETEIHIFRTWLQPAEEAVLARRQDAAAPARGAA